MTNRTNAGVERQSSLGPDCGNMEARLRSEIEFWREIIATSPDTQSSECMERMHQALALAESRLFAVVTAWHVDNTRNR